MGSGSAPSMPAPIDYSQFLTQASDNQLTAMRTQIGAQMIAQQQNSQNMQLSIMTNMVTQLEGLDTKMQIAKLNFVEAEDKIDLNFEKAKMEHEEKMADIDLRAHEMDQADHPQGNTPEHVASINRDGWNNSFNSFLGNGGSYTPPGPQEVHDSVIPPEGTGGSGS